MKNPIVKIFLLLLLFFLQSCSAEKQAQLTFEKMLLEYAENPINIDIVNPRFSWIVSSSKRNQQQSAYRILLATSTDLQVKYDTPIAVDFV